MDLNMEKNRFQLLIFIAAVIALSITAEKFRQLVGEEAASKSGKFTFLNCFDMGTGTLACSVKEGVKLYVNNFQTAHVELARSQAMEHTLTKAMSQGLSPKDAAKQAAIDGKKAAKLASRQAKRIIGPIISSGWDFFEAIYFGGSMTEGFLRGSGTLVGTYAGGFFGEQRIGKFGYLVGSQVGSWVGGRIGLMVYDVVNGINYLIQFGQSVVSEIQEFQDASEPYDSQEVSEPYESQEIYEPETIYESPEVYEPETYESPEVYEPETYESPKEVYGSDEL